MLLSSNVIKNTKVINQGKKEIVTDVNIEIKQQSLEEIKDILKNNSDNSIEKFDKIAQSIIDTARSEADKIKVQAISDAETIKTETYNKAYEEGKQSGYNDAYNETVIKGRAEADDIINTAKKDSSEIVASAKAEYEKYLLDKRVDIKKLAISIAEHILKREIREEDGIDEMIYDAVNESKNSTLIIIKCSKLHTASLTEAVELWKKQIPLKGEIFVIEDNSVSDGSTIIEKDNGKIEIGIDIGLENIKEEVMK
ncbi:flagellar assembly protein FliH [Clostridium pasteurianum DSM 525 = ATCC 6013]|uniref:Flagellar assembly protein FliH n=2 Tax=Clostridium pasteurianum TaxID=1501 RepID=A0A0H3J4K8_CLOPA|nr:hypothetical protein [Clostridium pasteurianum]AJA47887.1 flagellar assembly protein FliH [Clostridium pasteurianum DSM 525 = ATCC 6013]AJA51875.1 flagellar assembly protein FliH [Clostridium pasteurianum DSM 525 = ATCC 6013]AOZ75177.1 flagellar assembly protein FliH [Clostridium pasteurianum DSM 525 = ATCC 6013]AOZ78972.1 flagellar assembly protein FliH [Clostridium pasteurianum]ELP59790.1 Flagellar assembly protein FliH [Clostridium pasteurianum DSM 525 = ATCC 6013]